MKRLFTILIGLLLFCSIAAEIEFFKSKENLDVIIEYERQNDKELNTTFAYPAKQIEIEIIDYDSERELEKSVLLTDIEKNTSSFVFRELFAHSIQVDLTKYELNHLKIQISATERTDVPKTVSPVFIKLYESTVDNFETSYLRNLEIDYPKMLIITYDFLTEYLQDFVMWKMAKGIEVQIATIDDIGGSNNDIKSYIETQYQEWKPDYIILTGDVDDAYQIPSYYITFNGETDVTDLPYCMLDGDDYWPELLLGRISIDSPMELMTIVNKILFYEKTPNLESNWLDSALLIAGNYSNSPPTPTTPVRVTKWLRDKMLAYGYEDIDEYYYPGIYPGTNEIISSIDEGVGFVTYRGWGDANGWHYPHFKRDNVEQLNNGELLPVVTSMVCNTGDFANNVDPCFGELWLRAGWPTLPKGAVAFVGPSDLHTSTKYNNAIFSGFYQGLLTEGIHGFGSAVQRGKIELFNNYPNNQGLDDYVDFYFHVYNMLADPSLAMWTKTPEEIEISLPDEVSLGTNFLEVSLPNMDGAMVTAIKDGELLSKKRIEDGNAILLFNFDSTGEVLITITKPDYLPFTKNITVTSENEDLGIEDFEIIGDLVPGVQAQLQIEIKNYGSQSSNSIDVFLTTTDPKVEILDDTADVPVLNSGESEIVSFIFETNPDIEDDQIINFSIEDNEKILGKLEIQSKNVNFYVTEHSIIDENGFLEPGEMAQIVLELKNIGSLDANNIEAELVSECTALQVVEANYSIGDVSVGQIAEAEFSISAASDTYVGRSARLKIILESASQQVDLTYHDIVIGEITNTAPTGPDNFGYYAYDNYDVSYESVPEYNWIEIDPQEGGNGTVLEMGDDVSEAIAMPFEFTYYDEVCDSITICSNGWISMQPTWETNFRNWNIPAALGPNAMIAAYWDDLIGANEEDMRVVYFYDETNSKFIIEWNDCVNNFEGDSIEKFQIILYDPDIYETIDGNGEIQFNYHTVNNPDVNNNYATVGIENHAQNDGLKYTYASLYPLSATPLENGLAIKFTTNKPDSYTTTETEEVTPIADILKQNFPNPFNPETTIYFLLKESQQVKLQIFNAKGQLIRTLKQGEISSGSHRVVWNGRNDKGKSVGSGIYFYRLKTENDVFFRKCMLIK